MNMNSSIEMNMNSMNSTMEMNANSKLGFKAELNITIMDEDTTQMQQNVLQTIFWLEGVILPCIGLPGLVGNIITMMILRRAELDLKQGFRILVTSLLLWDTIVLILTLFIFSLPRVWTHYSVYILPLLIPHILPLAQISLTSSIYTTLAVAIERFMCVCRPHTKVPESMCLMVALGICIFSVAINSTRFFEYELKEIPVVSYTQYENGTLESAKNESVFIPFPTDMRQHPLYSKISTVTSILLLHLVPLISLCYLNFAIFTAIRARQQMLATTSGRQRRELVVATVLTAIVLVFLICHSLKFFINFVELWAVIRELNPHNVWSPKMTVVVSVSHLLITINCSTNFIIYCCKDNKFRGVISTALIRIHKVFSRKSQNSTLPPHLNIENCSDPENSGFRMEPLNITPSPSILSKTHSAVSQAGMNVTPTKPPSTNLLILSPTDATPLFPCSSPNPQGSSTSNPPEPKLSNPQSSITIQGSGSAHEVGSRNGSLQRSMTMTPTLLYPTPTPKLQFRSSSLKPTDDVKTYPIELQPPHPTSSTKHNYPRNRLYMQTSI